MVRRSGHKRPDATRLPVACDNVAEDIRLPDDALVIRFSPVTAEAVLRRAQLAHRESGSYRLSVFAAQAAEDETPEQLRARLLASAELDGIDPARNKKYYLCSSASKLYERGFKFVKDGLTGEPAEHYSVDVGPDPGLNDIERFLEAFESVEEWPS